jgi:PKD repeat protein
MSDIMPPTVDSVRPPAKGVPELAPEARRLRRLLIIIGGGAYLAYLAWCLILLAILPSFSMQSFVFFGVVTTMLGGIALTGGAGFSFWRIYQSRVTPTIQNQAFIRLAIFVPGILLSIFTPFVIMGEPPITIDMTPEDPRELIAPLSVDLSVERAVEVLRSRGQNPIEYRWDFEGDGEINEETVVPRVTAIYQRQGVYIVSVTFIMADSTTRSIARRIIIQQAVFSMVPIIPIVGYPVVFSVSHLFEDPKQIQEVQWDLNGDGQVDEVVKGSSVTYTYFRLGKVKVSATVILAKKAQARFERMIDVQNPPILPFPVVMKTEPNALLGPMPFGVLFSIETEEPIDQIVWNFGDGSKEEQGARIAHTFRKIGDYIVSAKVRSSTGITVELTDLVRVVPALQLYDLFFEGYPEVKSNKITGENPVTLNITPKTNVPFIQFSWEAPEATEIISSETTLQAIYRREGKYTITLIARDPDDYVLRLPISLDVRSPTSTVVIRMNPEGGVAPLFVELDASETIIPGETITGFEWEFGDRSPKTFGGARAEHIYAQAGTYVVTLIVRTTTGQNYSASKTIVVRAPVLDACILPSRTSGMVPLGVTFDSKCSTGNVTKYLWDFDDGAQSDQSNPVHLFEAPGTYNVRLQIWDAAGQVSENSVSITIRKQ